MEGSARRLSRISRSPQESSYFKKKSAAPSPFSAATRPDALLSSEGYLLPVQRFGEPAVAVLSPLGAHGGISALTVGGGDDDSTEGVRVGEVCWLRAGDDVDGRNCGIGGRDHDPRDRLGVFRRRLHAVDERGGRRHL